MCETVEEVINSDLTVVDLINWIDDIEIHFKSNYEIELNIQVRLEGDFSVIFVEKERGWMCTQELNNEELKYYWVINAIEVQYNTKIVAYLTKKLNENQKKMSRETLKGLSGITY